MSSGSTANYSLAYPLSTDPVNVAGDIESLANNIDSFLTTPAFINNLAIDGGSLVTGAITANLFNTNATTLNIGGSATATNIGNAAGQVNFAGDVSVATGKNYEINNVSVLSSTSLGSSVVDSSLTSVGTIATGTWDATTIAVNKGGTGITSYTIGDIIYASGSTTLSKLSNVVTGNTLLSGGVGVVPTWGKVGLTTHVSGTLPVANGGTGVTTSTGTGSTALSDSPTLTGIPISPTAISGTNTTQIATTEFVQNAVSSLEGLPDQTGNSGKFLTTDGSLASWAIVDLSSKANLASPTFTGTVTVSDFTATGTVNIISPTAAGSNGPRDITMSTDSPTGGLDGDVWLVYS
jgi:hypothetical protein